MWAILKWLGGGPLGRILDTVDNSMNNATEKEKVRTAAVIEYVKAQVAVLTGPGWWFPLFFIVPLGVWFSSVCYYSILFCRNCMFPQDWTIAALPPPLDEWAGAIITSLFIGASGMKIMAHWRR